MELLFFVVSPANGKCEAVIKFASKGDPTNADRYDSVTVTLDETSDLAGKLDYTNEDVARAVETKLNIAKGTVAVSA